MSKKAQAILVGLVLGDGYLGKPRGKLPHSYLDLKYDERYLGYLKWIHKELSELNPSSIKKKKNYIQYRFYTESRKDIGLLQRTFYPEGKKVVPLDIDKYLREPLSLAVWYQDDGTLDYRYHYHANSLIATHCFTYDECKLLSKVLKKNFGVDARVCRCLMRGKLYFRLYITSKSMPRFMDTIEPFIHKEFNYKLVKYRQTKM